MRIALRNASEIRKNMRRRVKAIRQAGVKTTLDAARLVSNKAKEFAPKKTGALITGILIRKTKEGHSVTSTVPGNFPYNKWVNASPGFEVLKYPKGAWLSPSKSYSGEWVNIVPRGGTASYGVSPSNWNWTGRRGFFDLAIQVTRRDIPKKLRDNVRKAIK